MLAHFPDIVGFEELSEVVILLLGRNLFYLSIDSIVVSRRINVADHTESNGETIVVTHQGEFQLQSVVLAVSIVNENIVNGTAILTNLNHLQSEALLYQTELIVLAEYQLFTMLYIDGVFLATLVVVNHIVAVVVEDDTVLQNFSDAGPLCS